MIERLKCRLLSRHSGNAYVEFGLLCPLLVTALGSVADFGLSIWSRARLSDAVSHGAQYAAVVGPGVSGVNVQSAVSKAVTPLTGVSVTVPSPACYCIGSPTQLQLWSNLSSGSCAAHPGTGSTFSASLTTCPSGNAPGVYTQITANYTYSPIMPFYAQVANPTLTEKAVVRLQ
jgi:Flp pilus assembly protein TadG